MKQQKAVFFDKLFPIFGSNHKVFDQENFIDLRVEPIGYSKRNLAKKVDEFCRVYNKGVKILDFS